MKKRALLGFLPALLLLAAALLALLAGGTENASAQVTHTLTISVKDGHTNIDEGGSRTLVFTLDSPAPAGGIDLGNMGAPTEGWLTVVTTVIVEGQTTKEFPLNANNDNDYTPRREITYTFPNDNNLPTSGSLTITLRINEDDPGPILVSNLGQTAGSTAENLNTTNTAQAFTTGSNHTGYALISVDVPVFINDNAAEDDISVGIYSDSNGDPGTLLTNLENPDISASNSFETITFTAPTDAGFQLDADTTYHLVIGTTSGGISGTPQIRHTTSDAEDSGAASGWSIANDRQTQPRVGGGAWTTFANSAQIRINGVANPPIPAECATANAQGAYLVDEHWALIPTGLSTGDKFRLLFVTSTNYAPTATDIAHYNTEIQTRAKAGHAAIGDSCGDLFRIVGSTSAVDARDNTGTTGTGEPIYWLNGAKLADDYADFYDGSWDDYGGRNEHGNTEGGDAWTGSNQDGTKHSTEYLGATGDMRVGTPQSGDNPINSYSDDTSSSNDYYGLSPVFIVGPPTLTISIKGGHTDIDEGGSRIVVFTLDSPAPPGGILLDDPGIPSGGSITVGSDLISEGETTKEFPIGANDDDDYTPGRVLTLTYPNNNNLPTSGSLTITLSVNEDELPQDSSGNYIVPEDWALIPQGFGPGDKFRLMFMTQGMRNAIPTNIAVYDTYVQGEAATGHAAIQDYAEYFKVVGSTSAVDARDHLDMNPGSDGAGHPVYWLNGPRIADNTAEFWSNNWQNWTLAHRRNAGGNEMTGSARSDWHWTGTRADGTAHPQLPLGSFDRVMRGRFQANTGDRDPLDHDGKPRGEDHSFYAMSPVFVVDGVTYLDPGSNPQTGKLVEIDKTRFKVDEPASCTDPDVGRKQNERDSDREGKWESTIADATTYSYNVRLARDPALDPKIDTVKVEVVGGSPPDWWTAHRAGFVTVEDKAPAIEPKQVLHFDSSNWNQWQNVQLRIHCADHFHFGDVPWRQFRHVSYTNNKRRDGRTFLQNEEPVVKVKVYDERIPALKDSYDRELSMQPDTHEVGFRGDDSQVINYVYWQWKAPGATDNDDVDADLYFSHWHMRLLADNSVGGNAPDHVKNVSTDEGYSFLPDGDYKAGMRMRGLPTKTTPGTAPTPKQYRLDITPVTLREEMAEGAKLTVCIEMRDVRPDWDTPNWRAFYIPCTPALLALSPQQMAPPVTPTVFIAGAGGGDEGQGSVFFINANPKPRSPLQVNVEVTATGDYGVTTGTRTITIPTSGLYDLNVATVDDEVDEPDGTVTLTLREGNGYQVGPVNTEVTDVFDNDLPLATALVTPQVSVTSASGGNEGEDAVFTLEASPKTDAALDVSIEVTATGDYGVTTGTHTVTIPASGSLRLTIATRNDKWDEPDGTVTVMVEAGDGYDVGAPASGTADIRDEDPPPIQVSVADAIAHEGDDLEFVISLDRAAENPIEVYYVTLDWDAWSPDDYAFANGTAAFAAGETQQTVSVPTVVDDRDEWGNEEGQERMLFDLSGVYAPGVQVEVGDSQAVGVISDDPVDTTPKPELSISGGGGITEGGTASFTITASFAPEDPITVRLGVSQNGDFGATGTATVTVSGATTTFTVNTHDDANDEPNGSVTATLQSGNGYTVSSSQGSAAVSVADNDLPPPVASITGGNGITEGGTASFTITVNPAPSSPITVQVGVSQNGDFGATGAATVSVSGASATYTVTTSDDSTDEPDGSVTATLQGGQGYTVSSSQGAASVNVADDDATPEVNVTSALSGPEGQDVIFVLTANPTPAANLPVSVTVTASGDYGVTTGTRVETIPTGGSVTVTLTTTDDSVDEPDGSVTLTLNGGQGYTVGSLSSETVTVTDNDEPRQQQQLPDPEVSITAGSGITEGGTATFTITANPAPSSPITVKVGVSENGDFGASGAATVTVSGATTTYTITTTDDSTDEADGSVTATLQTGSGYTVSSSQGTASVAVSDNDHPTPEVSITAGSGITEGGTATFTITASPAPSSPITVKVGISQDGDFGASGAATVQVSGTTTTYTVTTTDDSTDEADGSVTATLQSGSGYTVSSSQGAATVSVSDDDVPIPEVSITAGSGITEGGTATFTITASPAPASPITVKVGVSQDGDFGASGAATVQVSGASTTYTITTTDDADDEADGSVTATLQTGSGYTVSSSQGVASVAVSDNDVPEVSITAGSGITEGGTASFTITASPAPASPITVKVGVSQDGDFGASGAATVQVSGASTTYTVTTTDDSTDEADGSVTATLQTGQGYTVSSSQGAATVAVSDDDAPADGNSDTLTVSVADSESASPGEFLRFRVSTSETAQQEVTVTFGVEQIGGLVQGLDYCILSSDDEPADGFRCMSLPYEHDNEGGQVTIAEGADSAEVYVWIDRDARVPSGSPQIFVHLTKVDGAKGITDDSASGRVTE